MQFVVESLILPQNFHLYWNTMKQILDCDFTLYSSLLDHFLEFVSYCIFSVRLQSIWQTWNQVSINQFGFFRLRVVALLVRRRFLCPGFLAIEGVAGIRNSPSLDVKMWPFLDFDTTDRNHWKCFDFSSSFLTPCYICAAQTISVLVWLVNYHAREVQVSYCSFTFLYITIHGFLTAFDSILLYLCFWRLLAVFDGAHFLYFQHCINIQRLFTLVTVFK